MRMMGGGRDDAETFRVHVITAAIGREAFRNTALQDDIDLILLDISCGDEGSRHLIS